MAATQEDIGRLIVSIEANTKAYETSLNKALGVTNKSAQQIEKRFSQMSTNIGKNFDLSSINTALAAVGAGFTAKGLIAYADAWTSLGNKIAAAGVPLEQVGARLNQLTDIANEARTPVEAIASLYARVTLSSDNLNASQGEIIQTVQNVSKAMTLSGASTLEMQSAILQFSQALGSGVLQGDELRSLRENAPLIAQAIAKEFKVTVGELKKLGEEGKLTSDRVLAAIVNATDGIDAAFAKTTPTIAQATVVLNNAFTQFIGTSGTVQAAAETLSKTLLYLAKNFDEVATIAGALAVGFAAYAVAGTAAAAKTVTLVATLGSMLLAMRSGTAAALVLTAAYTRLGVASGLAGKSVGALGLALAKNPLTYAIIAATGAGYALYTMGESTREVRDETENMNTKLREATDAQTELGKVTRMIAEKDFAAATAAFGEMTEGVDTYLQKRKELLEEQQRNALTEAVTSAFNAAGLNEYQLSLERIEGRTNQLRESLIGAQLIADIGLGINAEEDVAQLAKIEAAVAQTRATLIAKEALKLGIDPVIYADLERVRSEIQRAISAKNYSGAELILDKLIDDSAKLPAEIQKSAIGPLLKLKKTLETTTGSNYTLKLGTENITAFTSLVNGAAKSTSSLKDVLDNLEKYKPGDLGAREVAQLAQATEGAKLRMNQLRNETSSFGEGPLKRLAETGRITIEFKAQIDDLIQSFVTGKVSGEQFATMLAQVGTQNPSMAVFLTGLNQVAAQAAAGEAEVKKLAQAGKLIGKGGPTQFATDKPTERSPFEKQIDFLKAAAKQSDNRTEALRRLNPEAEKYNELLDAENQYAERRRAIESAGATVQTGSRQDQQLRALAAQAAASKAAERQIETSNALQRQFMLEAVALGRQEAEYAKLKPTQAGYALELAKTEEFLKRVAAATASGQVLAAGEEASIRASANAYAERKFQLDANASVSGAINNAATKQETALKNEIAALASLNPLVADYAFQKEKARIAADLTTAKGTVALTEAEAAAIDKLATSNAKLVVTRNASASVSSAINDAATKQKSNLENEIAALEKLNPLTADYAFQKEKARIANELTSSKGGVALTEAEALAIDTLSTALANLNTKRSAVASNQDFAKSMTDAKNAATLEAQAMTGLNPLYGDYVVKAKAAAMAADELARRRAAGIATSPAEVEAIKAQTQATAEAQVATERLKTTQQEYNTLSQDATKGFVKDLIAGKSAADALSGALTKVADKLLDMALNAAFSQTSSGNVGSFFASIFGRATGGPVNAGTPYVVGESGREVFVPNRDGRIIPNKDLKGGAGSGGSTTVNISNYSGQNVQQQSRRDGNREIIDVVIGEVSRRMAGGDFDKSMGNRYGGMPRTIAR